MIKRRFGNRPDWRRILKKSYAQAYYETDAFSGYSSLIQLHSVTEPLIVNQQQRTVCIADNGYQWLQLFPNDKNHAATTMYNENGDVIQWYIDICQSIGSEKDIPYMDDLYLDIIVFPDGEIMLVDEDELEEALAEGTIDKKQYQLARNEANKILRDIKAGTFRLIELSHQHKKLLEPHLTICK
ncbi:DUF402 domain-containing protein [Bacillus sp. 1P06AnD]|uniref:DUF402 domain-containing protein n=1 Tax=Bacillus sp. 1P06AnD TaxID=3132208 RepID=UPI0039A31D09